MKLSQLFSFAMILFLTSCIGDDFVEDFVSPQIRVAGSPAIVTADTLYQLQITFFNNVGQPEEVAFSFRSSNEDVLTVDASGLVTTLSEGSSLITISTDYADEVVEEVIQVIVASETVTAVPLAGSGTISTTSSYELSGSFTMTTTDTGVRIELSSDYVASTALPGLYIYLTNNKSTNIGALEIARVQVFEGAHIYDIPNVSVDDYSHILYFCKPFGVKVGDGQINI